MRMLRKARGARPTSQTHHRLSPVVGLEVHLGAVFDLHKLVILELDRIGGLALGGLGCARYGRTWKCLD